MKSFDYYACTYDGEVYCTECLPVSENDDEVSPIFADSEWTYVPVCTSCQETHDYVNIIGRNEDVEDDEN